MGATVALWEEQLFCDWKVVGSTPASSCHMSMRATWALNSKLPTNLHISV